MAYGIDRTVISTKMSMRRKRALKVVNNIGNVWAKHRQDVDDMFELWASNLSAEGRAEAVGILHKIDKDLAALTV